MTVPVDKPLSTLLWRKQLHLGTCPSPLIYDRRSDQKIVATLVDSAYYSLQYRSVRHGWAMDDTVEEGQTGEAVEVEGSVDAVVYGYENGQFVVLVAMQVELRQDQGEDYVDLKVTP